MRRPVFIGIAGGTGAGKSTVSLALLDKYPNQIGIIHFDDYHKKRDQVPVVYGMPNWDHPDAIDWIRLLRDLKGLKEGKTISVQTKCERCNPRYKEVGRVVVKIHLKPVMLVGGYLVLWHPKVRKLLDLKIFLDLEHQVRIQRRTKFKDETYIKKILLPMHKKYIEPTKRYADYVIDVEDQSVEEVTKYVEKIVGSFIKKI